MKPTDSHQNDASMSMSVSTESVISASNPNDPSKFAVLTIPEMCKCGQFKTSESGVVQGQCSTLSCRRFWCLVKNCGYETKSRDSIRIHINTHLQFADPDKCFHCGSKKHRGTENTGQCPVCNAYWCLIKECKFEHKFILGFKSHQKRKCEAVKSLPKNTCACGNIKTPTLTKNKGFCHVCKLYWCMVDNCFEEFKYDHSLDGHLKIHRNISDKTKCFNCKANKPTRNKNTTIGQCSNCNIFWCLTDNCKEENMLKSAVVNHQITSH